MKGYSFNPTLISKANYTQLVNIISKGGIILLNDDLCDVKDTDFDNIFNASISSFVGDEFTILVIPKCLYENYKIRIG